MTGLRRLAVPGNDISVLPEGRYLQSLQYLDISCNSCVLLLLVVRGQGCDYLLRRYAGLNANGAAACLQAACCS